MQHVNPSSLDRDLSDHIHCTPNLFMSQLLLFEKGDRSREASVHCVAECFIKGMLGGLESSNNGV